MKSWIGIDPGASGCLCHLFEDNTVTFIDFKATKLLGYITYLEATDLSDVCMVATEAVHAMKGQGVSSMFSFGQRLGELEGMLQTLHIGYELVRPQAWQKSCQITPKSGKQGTFQVMSKLYPSALLTGPKGGILDGRCDALGIAHYLRKTYN